MTQATPTRARLYHSVRSAHLERAHALAPATILYSEKRYDFDEALTHGLQLEPGSGLRAARWLWRHPPAILEVNEPLMIESSVWTAVTITALRLRRLLGGPPCRIVTYAIENRDPLLTPVPVRWRSRVRRLAERFAMCVVWRAVDRIVYGTEAAEELYTRVFGRSAATSVVIPALPAADQQGAESRPATVVFVSAFSERKGVPQLLAAWPAVKQELPDSRLVMIGKGALLGEVARAAAEAPGIEVLVDPPRVKIRATLSAASVVTLPSQPTDTWREQVGLPIVEGLAHGCTIVTTTETGLASWLQTHGHRVVPGSGSPGDLAEALVSALTQPVDPRLVRASLPIRDGRLAADDWMMGK